MKLEDQLIGFFRRVGEELSAMIKLEIKQYIPLMKKYPEIVKKYIHRFGIYFTVGTTMNHHAALDCLIDIAQNVPEVREQITTDLGPLFTEWGPMWEGDPKGEKLKKLHKILELPLPKKEEYLKSIARSIITLQKPIILVIGAGFSYDTMPITNELQPLLVQLLREKDISSPAKLIQENDEQAWIIVKENESRFKDMFAGWCVRSNPAPQHEIVAEMFQKGMISHLISFNWDDLIERSYQTQYGKDIAKITVDDVIPDQPRMWKLHGDVENTSSKWIFPYEKGCVFDNLIKSLNNSIVSDCPQFALIVGYSEWEMDVRDKLIKWLEANIPTILRIRPNLPDDTDLYISETSKNFFQQLHVYLEKEAKS